ncbi:pentapeptide repeat-containing protein [Gracilibacillus oryzae]|uniref:Pentapeptide repeat-containing protein n=1 Tax=Gracilibacillus oryzae TaxID=1672701 RepID=A0A7C8GRM8_9BACI|nr:pentapeptide repeat-containing protein [Gracilibacillus oryzae]KAB8128324.1 pentapeptide repeat-containing protein [Gracilibacillus oryzae]
MNDNQYLKSDCENCFALCCVALPYMQSNEFAFNKAAGEPCRHLQNNFLCGIHQELRNKGFKGCTVYECFGAGQKVAQQIYHGENWRDNPETAEEMFLVFPKVQQLHEILYYLNEAAQRTETQPIHGKLMEVFAKIDYYTKLEAEAILKVDISEQRAMVNPILMKASEMVRNEYKQNTRLPLELIGANLRNKKLAGMNFRGSLLIAANLSGADLRGADFIGADLRDTNLNGANLDKCIFLTQTQLNAAKGDQNTILPVHLHKPAHWLKASS